MSEEAMKVWREVHQAPTPLLGAAVIAAAMAADKARIVELEGAIARALDAPMLDHSQKGRDVCSILRATLKPENPSHAG
jgi:hypothetical protein